MENFSAHMLQILRDYSWDKESWFLPLAPAIDGITTKEAAWQPSGGGNTIWQTVNHINYFNDLMIRRIKGFQDLMIRRIKGFQASSSLMNSATFGQPGNPNDDVGWQNTVETTHRIAHELKETLTSLSDDDLAKNELGAKLTAWVMHDAYHTGQIVLLRKMQASWPAVRDE